MQFALTQPSVKSLQNIYEFSSILAEIFSSHNIFTDPTEDGAKTLKSHLKSVPKYEKAKPQFQALWKRVCEAVNQHHNLKQKKIKAQQRLEEYKQLVTVTKNCKQPRYFIQSTKIKSKTRNAVLMLAKLYPNTFNCHHPKPLKLNLREELKNLKLMDNTLLNRTLNYYTQSAKYYHSFLQDSYRYDLSGKAVATITEADKIWAVGAMYHAIGRLTMESDYPELVDQVINKDFIETPATVVTADYGNHYYAETLFDEIVEILRDCYGKSFCLLEKTNWTKTRFVSVIQVMRQNEFLFETEAEGISMQKAQHLALSRLLSRLQNEIDAYPFEYEKNFLSHDS